MIMVRVWVKIEMKLLIIHPSYISDDIIEGVPQCSGYGDGDLMQCLP